MGQYMDIIAINYIGNADIINIIARFRVRQLRVDVLAVILSLH